MVINNPFAKVLDSLKTANHDYRINTELLGQLDVEKVSKELELEKLGRTRGEDNLPVGNSAAFDDVETQIVERISSAKKQANEIVENEFLTYKTRISNLDLEGQFHNIRQAGPMAISNFKADIEIGLNDMHLKRRKLLDIEKEFDHFRNTNDLIFRTAKTGVVAWIRLWAEVSLTHRYRSSDNLELGTAKFGHFV